MTTCGDGVCDQIGRKPETRCVKLFLFVVLVVEILSVYTLYTYYRDLEEKCELRFRQLQDRMNAYESSPSFGYHRVRRQTGNTIQDDGKAIVDDSKFLASSLENDISAKNTTSSLTLDDFLHLKQNFTNETWIWLNEYSRIPVSTSIRARAIDPNRTILRGSIVIPIQVNSYGRFL